MHSSNNLQNQNVLNRLKVAEKWPPGGRALESKTHSAAAARFRIQIYNLARNMFLHLSCLGLAAGEGPLGQDTEDVTDIALSCHHQVHWWIMWIFMVTRQWQCIIVCSYDVCAHCGDWRREQLVRIRILARGDTYSDQATLHHYYQVHQIRSYD